ncbi:MAG TPA: copper homeostasis protein CutC [Gemmatimonadales bacterium]|nr:copper homeostasis protein CutC [Gemmatimonadales bacterium]
MSRILVEACVDTLAGARAAEAGGANRIELCVSLEVGGLTPPAELITDCVTALSLPVFVLVRPDARSFVMREASLAALLEEVRRVAALGAAGVVAGALTAVGAVDAAATAAIVAAARPAPVTFHRAFDAVADQPAALEALVDLGVARILTSGGAATAAEGADRLRGLVDLADGRIGILAGGSIRAHNVGALIRRAGVTEIHSRTPADAAGVRALVQAAAASELPTER